MNADVRQPCPRFRSIYASGSCEGRMGGDQTKPARRGRRIRPGILIFEVFNHGGFYTNEQVGKTTNIPPSMQQSYKRLCAANPKLRLKAGQFVEQGKRHGGFFQTPLIRVTDDIESLGLKNDAEREEVIK